MENELICLDGSVLIDYFRKTNKSNSFLYQLTQEHSLFAVSVITEYEVYAGSNPEQDEFWDKLFELITVIPFDSKANQVAVQVYRDLKGQGNLIDIPDLLIGATAKANKLRLATLNEKHFNRIEELDLILKVKG